MQIKSVVIVGGGSSGWMTAAALSKWFKDLKITLIESKNIPIIGVGESSLAEINSFLEILGLQDHEWMPLCNATYKTSIRFSNFLKEDFYYSDILKNITPPIPNIVADDFFILTKLYPEKLKVTDFSKFYDDTHSMIEKNKFTKNLDKKINFDFDYEKAYHFDAHEFGKALASKIAIPNGVTHIEDEVINIVTNSQNGSIDYLETTQNGNISADLFIDCSGFKSMLLGKTLDVKFNSFSDKMINDSAVVANIPYQDKEQELTTWTDCVRMDSGWFWNIPIWNRIGTGYVYSSKFADAETATRDYTQYLKQRYGNRADNIEIKHIKFTPGVRENSWYKNVVGIGLASGFLEPLRSTGLLVTHRGITLLLNTLSRTNCYVKNIDKEIFSTSMKNTLSEFRDFVFLQYAMSRRDDTPYWKHITQNVNLGELQNTKWFDSFLKICTTPKITNDSTLFDLRLLTGYDYNPITDISFNLALSKNYINTEYYKNLLDSWEKRKQVIDQHIETLPSHLKFLETEIYKTNDN